MYYLQKKLSDTCFVNFLTFPVSFLYKSYKVLISAAVIMPHLQSNFHFKRFFGMLQGGGHSLDSDIGKICNDLKMREKFRCYIKDLSGGTKRKTNLAISLIGKRSLSEWYLFVFFVLALTNHFFTKKVNKAGEVLQTWYRGTILKKSLAFFFK